MAFNPRKLDMGSIQRNAMIGNAKWRARFAEDWPAERLLAAEDELDRMDEDAFAEFAYAWEVVFGEAWLSGAGDVSGDVLPKVHGNRIVPRAEPFAAMGDLTLTIWQVAHVLDCKLRVIRYMVRDGRLPKARQLSARRIGWTASDIADWIRSPRR